ncbi:hypothetical protein DFH07DRAFT_751563 [Mycena maculata]|uniref:rRNA-processing protein FYV7 n=1 Tax=Mycena maculata TaxID=230809 RepID=A0AAD7IDR4_9AGAR|nr:hypothetical protein DFH07DRAFT_751563 [Mycena maculata]
MPETRGKRKRPPSFDHFPPNRAKKLKQAWVQNTKLKSKWKAEKRKSGLVVPPTKGDEDTAENDPEAEETKTESSPQARNPTPIAPPKKRARRMQPDPTEAESSSGPTLRDRAREAYSQASLHTYRSDPFGKRQRGGRNGATGTTGRGQPNMKKRMDVLLETIKRDFT